MATIIKGQSVYHGPSKSYAIVGSVGNNEPVNLRWKEVRDNANWAYIEYDVDGKPGIKKSGYVPFDQVSGGVTSLVVKAKREKRYIRRSCVPFFGRSNIGYAPTDGLDKGTIVYYTGVKYNNYAFVENENANKRFWVYDQNLSDSFPVNAVSNSLNFPYAFQQQSDDGKTCDWSECSSDFKRAGCAVCCAADVASYLENAYISPAVLLERGVFTKTDVTCNWDKASEKCFWNYSRYTGENYLQVIVQNINSSLPVIIELQGHFVVAYGYVNDGLRMEDILVKDPMGSQYDTLKKATTRNNHPFKNLRLLCRK